MLSIVEGDGEGAKDWEGAVRELSMMNRYNLCAFCEKATLPYLRSTSYMPYGGECCNFRICKLCDEEMCGVAEEAFGEFDWVEEQDPRIPSASFASRPGSVQFGLLFSFQHMCVEKLQRFYGLHELAHLRFSKWKCDDGYPLDIWEQIDSISWEYPLRSIMFQMVATLGVAVHQNMTDCRPIYIMSMLKGKELDKERKADMSKNTIYSDNLSDFMLDLHDMATTSGSRFCSDDNFRQVISTHSLSLRLREAPLHLTIGLHATEFEPSCDCPLQPTNTAHERACDSVAVHGGPLQESAGAGIQAPGCRQCDGPPEVKL